MPVKITVTLCRDHSVPASYGWFWARSYFCTNILPYLMHRPRHTVVINVANKWGLIFNAVNCFSYRRRVLLWGNCRVISYTKHPPFFWKARLIASAVFLVSVSSFPECENFIAHYLLGCDEVTDDLLGAKNCVSTANIFILFYGSPQASCNRRGNK